MRSALNGPTHARPKNGPYFPNAIEEKNAMGTERKHETTRKRLTIPFPAIGSLPSAWDHAAEMPVRQAARGVCHGDQSLVLPVRW